MKHPHLQGPILIHQAPRDPAARGLVWSLALTLIAVCALFALFGCGAQRAEDQNPSASSSMTKADAIVTAKLWAMLGPGRGWSEVQPTGSMAPTIDSRSVLLLERLKPGETLVRNDIAIYSRPGADVAAACHRATDVRPDGIRFAGDNNHTSDGWIPPERVQWRVAGILNTRRTP